MKAPVQMNRCTWAAALAVATLQVGLAGAAAAQAAADKSVVPEAVAAVPALTQWFGSRTLIAEPAPVAQVVTVPFTAASSAATPVADPLARFEPLPVILGAPELPLVGAGVQHAANNWSGAFNYQGMHVRLLVLDSSGRRVESRPLSALPKSGERFKIRVTTTFDAVTDVSLVTGDAWVAQRAGQLYPARGMSVQMNAGETVDLPMEPERYFMLGNSGAERLLLSVRDAQAPSAARTTQPAYRQDARTGSTYLQLTPAGLRPAMEQLIAAAPR